MSLLTPTAQPDPFSVRVAPPLENGDRLTRPEFERRYAAMPENVRAELVEGIVVIASPVRHTMHGAQQAQLITWAGNYHWSFGMKTIFAAFLICASSLPGSAEEPKGAVEDKAVRQVLEDQAAAWNKGDLEGFMKGYWNSEKLTFYSGKDKRLGWKETLERYRKRYQGEGKEMGKLKFSGLEITLLGPDAVLVKGEWELTLSKEKIGGLFTLILKETKDGWKIVHDHTSG